MTLNKPQYKILKKDTPFTIVRANGTEETKARKNVTILFLQRIMGQSYFKLAGMTCRTTVALSILLLIGCSNPCFSQDIPSSRAVRAIIGEAENQGYLGMLYVACAIRNRETLKGVYGEHSQRIKNHSYSEETKELATVAWESSKTSDECKELNGAKNWENINAFGLPLWTKRMRETFRYKDHVFYRS